MKTILLFLAAISPLAAIETPAYDSIEKDGLFEIRKYESIQVVTAPMEGMDKRNESFGKLFKYISGDNAGAEKIAMTSPVFMDEKGFGKDAEGKTGTMSFVIPSKVVEAGAPAPKEDGMALTTIKGGTFAILRFKGWSQTDQREKALEKLRELIAARKLTTIGDPVFAFYDPPWKPEFMRRNEAWQRVAEK